MDQPKKSCEIEIKKVDGVAKIRISPDCSKEMIEALNIKKIAE